MTQDIHGYSQAKATHLSRQEIENIAEHISSEIENLSELSAREIVNAFGGKLQYEEVLDGSNDGSIHVNGVSDFTICLPFLTSSLRDRFTIAHEIGHYFLHYLWNKFKDENQGPICAYRYPNSADDRVEWEANWFAAALLMPKTNFIEKWDQTHSISEVAGYFGVSTAAAKIRAKYLNLI